MKKIYSTLSLIALFVGANAQNAAIRNSNLIENEAVINRNLKDVAAVSTSTVVQLLPPGIATSSCAIITGLTAEGFLAGTNKSLDKEFSQRFDLTKNGLTTPASISSVVMLFAGGTGTGSVVAKIYADNLGTPAGALLGTSLPIAVTSCTGTTTTFTFSSPVNLTTSKFHVSLELPSGYTYTSNTVNGTNLGLLLSRACAVDEEKTIYFRDKNGDWFDLAASYPSFNKKGSFGIQANVSATISTDISENQKLNNTFRIFPNPATNQLSINFLQNQKSVNLINIFDVTGKLVLSSSVQDKLSSNNTITLDLSNLNSGIYMVEAKTDDISVFDKVMISK